MRLPGLLPGPADLIRIENLGLLKGLRKLCLDNNMIAKIEGLESLTGLTWLDLSFNKIAKIEGLDKLTALTDLSLFNNEIKVIEGLDANVNLQCLSLGNNLIEAVDQASGGRWPAAGCSGCRGRQELPLLGCALHRPLSRPRPRSLCLAPMPACLPAAAACPQAAADPVPQAAA